MYNKGNSQHVRAVRCIGALDAGNGMRGWQEVGANLRVHGDGLATELVELFLAHHVASHNDEWGERSALAVATYHDSTSRNGASLGSGTGA